MQPCAIANGVERFVDSIVVPVSIDRGRRGGAMEYHIASMPIAVLEGPVTSRGFVLHRNYKCSLSAC